MTIWFNVLSFIGFLFLMAVTASYIDDHVTWKPYCTGIWRINGMIHWFKE